MPEGGGARATGAAGRPVGFLLLLVLTILLGARTGYAQTTVTVWSASLNPESPINQSAAAGYCGPDSQSPPKCIVNPSDYDPYGTLSATGFTVGTNTVLSLRHGQTTTDSPQRLHLTLSTPLSDDDKAALVLHIGSTTFALSAAELGRTGVGNQTAYDTSNYRWEITSSPWTVGTAISVSLQKPAVTTTPPDPPPTTTKPDLVVDSPSVSESSPMAGAGFTLSTKVRNRGDGNSAATTLRYYRSANATISASDTSVGSDTVRALLASGTSAESIELTAPTAAGTYYYGACVEAVSGESRRTNNCSTSVQVDVVAGVPALPLLGQLFLALALVVAAGVRQAVRRRQNYY